MGVRTKTEIAVENWLSGKRTEALAIFKTFKAGITKEEKETLVLAYEIKKHPDFYKSLGHDENKIWNDAENIVEKVFIK